MSNQTEAEVVAELARAGSESKVFDLTDPSTGLKAQLLVVRSAHGPTIISAADYVVPPRPKRRGGTAVLLDIESFIDHVKRYGSPSTVVFADPAKGGPSLTAVYDYNEAGPEAEKAQFMGHRATYKFPLSEAWKVWTGATKREGGFDLEAFAAFIEDRIADVVDPMTAKDFARDMATKLGCSYASPTRVMELSRGLSVHVGQQVRGSTNLSSGERALGFVETHTDETGAPIAVPGAMLIAIQIYENGPLYQVPVRIRYRVASGRVFWFLDLYRTDVIFEDAFKESEDLLVEAGFTVFRGSPELPGTQGKV